MFKSLKYQYRILIFSISLSGLAITNSSGQITGDQQYWNKIFLRQNQIAERILPMPAKFCSYNLNLNKLKSILIHAPLEDLSSFHNNKGVIIELPLPDGTFHRFEVQESPIMEADLAREFPFIKTFIATVINKPEITARIDYTELGFHAMIMDPAGWSFIEPVTIGNTAEYLCYYKQDSRSKQDFDCGVEGDNVHEPERKLLNNNSIVAKTNGANLRTYRLALACTGEYAAVFGGTVTAAMSAITTSVNRVNGVYEKEVSIRMILVANNSSIVYTNSATDPFSNGNGSTMLGQNQTTCDGVIGSANYDFGHVFSTGGGGIAQLQVPCVAGNKAKGVTGSSAPFGDGYDIDYVAHEMGHQFGGNHTFNSVTSSCNGNRNASTAYETGSGITIMAYAGICGSDNLAPNSIAYFHTKSFEEIVNYSTTGNGNLCPVITATGNLTPVVNAGADYSIPISTPFILTGSATDGNSDPLTYSWEEMDQTATGGSVTQTQVANVDFPLFRPFEPVTIPSRTFPKIADIVNNTTTIGERLPTVTRILDFRFTARDNRVGGGGVTYNDVNQKVTVVATAGPFTVTAPNTAVTWSTGTIQTVTWNVANTTASPVSCANVKISLSNDGGFTYPTVILASTPNDGTEGITVPNVITAQARIKVEAVGNIFFDISNTNFIIQAGSPTLTTITTQPLATNNFCAGAAVAISFTTDGPANAGNIFRAQLSNAAGFFVNPDTIGSLSSINSGTINGTIPAGKSPGNGYRIRVVSSNPSITGSDNGSNVSIYATPSAAGSITGNMNPCQGQNGVPYSVALINNATTYNWSLPPGASIASGSGTNNITVDFSASASSGVITVTGSNTGCNGAVSPNFSVTLNTLPSSAGPITGTATVCQGQTGVNFNVPSIAGATSYSWTLPTGAIITNGSTTNAITVSFSSSAVTGNISVSGTNACGNGTSSSFAVSVNPTATPPVISASGSTTVCTPATVNLSFTPTAGVAYQWRLNGVNIGGASSSAYSANQTGNYDVTATGTAPQAFITSTYTAIPDNNCTGAASPIVVSGYASNVNSSSIYIKIDSLTHTWDGDLAIFLQAPNGAILGLANLVGSSGDNFINTVFADSASAQIPATYTTNYSGLYKPWTTIFTSCITSTITTFAALGGGTINPNGTWTLRAYDRAAQDTGIIKRWSIYFPLALSSCSGISNSIPVTINSTVIAGVNIAASPSGAICSGTKVTFAATPFNGGTTPVYQWKKNGSNVGINSVSYADSLLNNNDVISCVMTSNANCTANNPATSNSISMTVNANVTASVSISANPSNIICSGTNVMFTATPANGGTTPVYQWKKNGSNVGSNQSTYADAGFNNNDVITCLMNSNATCVNGSPATSNSITMTVNPNVTPSVSISASPSNIICSGVNVTFTATPVNGGTSPVYQWKKNGSNTGTNSSGYSDNTLNDHDVITCELTSTASCVTGNPASSNSISMSVNPNVTAGVSISSFPSDAICSGTNITFTATPVNGGASPSYHWKKNGNDVGTDNNTYADSTLNNNDVIVCEMTSNANCVSGNPAFSNTISAIVIQSADIKDFFPATVTGDGDSITISGTGFANATQVTFNGTAATYVINNDSVITAIVPAGATTGFITITASCGSATSDSTFTIVTVAKLNIKVFIEGFYAGGGLMTPVLYNSSLTSDASACDSIILSLRQSMTPFAADTVLKELLAVDGSISFELPSSRIGNTYFISILSRNGTEIWSKQPVTIGNNTNFDFSQ